LVHAQEKSAITRSVAWGGNLIEQRTLNFNSLRRQEYAGRPMAGWFTLSAHQPPPLRTSEEDASR
jgi:hypothetical protein